MPLPTLHYRLDSANSKGAYELWRELMAPMYDIELAQHASALPGGIVTAVLVGDILANRTSFSAQRVTRSKRLISRTPDHLVLQLWRTGGTRGEVDGKHASYKPGQVALADRRLEVDSLITRSDTLGVVIPRNLLHGMNLDALPRHLDGRRNQLATARLQSLWRRVQGLEPSDIASVTQEFVGFFRQLFDSSPAHDVLERPELAQDFLTLAERVIDANLASSTLTPEMVAASIGLSRAGLYRLFAPYGGIMRYVSERRLAALRHALADPLETRSISRLADEYGFNSLPLLSRSFRGRYGMPPRDWRADARRRWQILRQTTPEPIWRWFNDLGR